MMKYLQKLGKSLMLPVACLPVAAILMGIGYWIDPTGWGANNIAAAFLIKAGSALVDNMVRGGGDCVVLSCATRGEQGTGEIPPRFSSHNNALSSICGVLWGYCVGIKMI